MPKSYFTAEEQVIITNLELLSRARRVLGKESFVSMREIMNQIELEEIRNANRRAGPPSAFARTERAFLDKNQETLSRIETLWKNNRQGLAHKVQSFLGAVLESRYVNDLTALENSRINLDGAAGRDLVPSITEAQYKDCFSQFGAVEDFRKHNLRGPSLTFFFPEPYLVRGTLCTIIDMRPLILADGRKKRVARDQVLSHAKLIFRDRGGPQWQFRPAQDISKFSGWWTRPGALTLDALALAQGNAKAIRCVDVVVRQFCQLCAILREQR